MASSLDPTTISGLTITPAGPDLILRWTSTAPPGDWFQVYVGGRLAWSGPTWRAVVGAPASSPCQIVVGSVPAGLAGSNLLATLAAPPPPDRAMLRWLGGSYLSPDLESFRVYGAAAPGEPATASLATVPAFPGGDRAGGFGAGPFGSGAFGDSGSEYSWTSGPLRPGPWSFEVRPVDSAGVEGPGVAFPVAIAGPPRAPRGVVAAVEPGTGRVLLSWAPSPSASSP